MTAPATSAVAQKEERNDSFRSFEDIKQTRPDGSVFWSARDLMKKMGYAAWREFKVPIERAMKAAENQKIDLNSQFGVSPNLVKRAQGGGNASGDYHLSRFAAYLVAMNGDPNKSEVAEAQAYFAVQTHFAESVQNGKISVGAAPTASAEIGTKYDLTLEEFRRVVSPEDVNSPVAAALAAALQNLSYVMCTPLIHNDKEMTKAISAPLPSPSDGNGESHQVDVPGVAKPKTGVASKSKSGAIPEELPPFVSQAGREVKHAYRERNIPISEEAEVPLVYAEFAKAVGLEHCGRCGQALSNRMGFIARREGRHWGRRADQSLYPFDFWLESWVVLADHLSRLHADHARNHEAGSHA
ncbi:MAG: hypothetical protein E6R04_11105 [Spirochaetes bacterium]|nr:MAG: hypothetical protein E6R04_11105 [Spirochaetota bacterium]